MKILYAIQATGNGHISRAMELLPYLETYGDVDIFLSGANSTLPLAAPVKYRSKGLCLFYGNQGGISYQKMLRHFAPLRVMREVRDLPVEKYDVVLNDFESITALACAFKKIPSVNFGHQASFQSPKTPRPAKRDRIGEWILKNYARATQYVGLHFEQYDEFILPPVIKKQIQLADPIDRGHITVYLPSYREKELCAHFAAFPDLRFHIFTREAGEQKNFGNLEILPVNNKQFTKSLIECHGIITGAGFETPAEALYLGKKALVIPIRGQYEQYCNAAALERLGIPCLQSLDQLSSGQLSSWLNNPYKVSLRPDHSTSAIVSYLMHYCTGRKFELDICYPELVI